MGFAPTELPGRSRVGSNICAEGSNVRTGVLKAQVEATSQCKPVVTRALGDHVRMRDG